MELQRGIALDCRPLRDRDPSPQGNLRSRIRQRLHHLLPAAAKRCLGQLRGPIRVAINKRRHQIVVKVVELVLAVPQRKPQVDDALMLLHQADDQGGKALVTAGLRDVAVKLPVGPEI